VQTVLFDFGRALFPALVATYGALIPSGWDALDLVEHTEEVIHRAVRLQDPTTAPPRLTAARVSPSEVRLLYNSSRKLCSLARGLLTEAGEYFAQPVTLIEERCVHRGDAFCEFVVQAAHEAVDRPKPATAS
jgi:predicted hydrocarbon binding protein